MDGDMIFGGIILIFLSLILGGFIIACTSFVGTLFGDRIKYKTALVITLIEFALRAIFQFVVILPLVYYMCDTDGDVREYASTYNIISAIIVICFSRLFWLSLRNNAIICPHCGVWNEYINLGNLSRESYDTWEIVKRDIRNNKGEKIGTYDSRELHTLHASSYRLMCKKCEKEFTRYIRYTTDE